MAAPPAGQITLKLLTPSPGGWLNPAESDYTMSTNMLLKYKPSYNYCRICGHTPGANDEPNYAPIHYWDCDDGWIIGTLCRWCYDEFGQAQPHPDDYAYHTTNDVCDEECTDEDAIVALYPILSEYIK